MKTNILDKHFDYEFDDKILITGTAGFIGFHLAKKLLDKKFQVIGIDGLTDYYDINLKLLGIKFFKYKNFCREEFC